MAQQVVFIIIAVVTLGSALVVVTSRNLFHAALAMMLSFLGIAGFFAMLEAGFLAATQLLVYIGAISILIIFAIMMTRRLMSTTEDPFNSQWPFALVGSIIMFLLLGYTIVTMFGPAITVGNLSPQPLLLGATQSVPGPEQGVDPSVIENSVAAMGLSFVSADAYVIPFEVASVLLLAALVGAIVIARPREGEE
jgi:NADH-quinone oxidoreductase subunit J